jgi:hypothetical protein
VPALKVMYEYSVYRRVKGNQSSLKTVWISQVRMHVSFQRAAIHTSGREVILMSHRIAVAGRIGSNWRRSGPSVPGKDTDALASRMYGRLALVESEAGDTRLRHSQE